MNSLPDPAYDEVIALIEELGPAPRRDPRAAANGRLKFQAEVRACRGTTVSAPREQRHINWRTLFSRKAQLNMSMLTILLTLCAIVFGGTGATVYAARGSLPDQQLYPVKLASEDLQTRLPASTQQHVALAMDFADLRLQEALQLAGEGKTVPPTLWNRMEQHIDLGLSAAADLADHPLHEELLRIQSRLRTELPKAEQLAADSRYRAAGEQAQAILQSNLLLVQMGLDDPAGFRQMMQSGKQPALLPAQATPTATATALSVAPLLTGTPHVDDDDDDSCSSKLGFREDDCDDDLGEDDDDDIDDDDDPEDDDKEDDDKEDDDEEDDDGKDDDGEDD